MSFKKKNKQEFSMVKFFLIPPSDSFISFFLLQETEMRIEGLHEEFTCIIFLSCRKAQFPWFCALTLSCKIFRVWCFLFITCFFLTKFLFLLFSSHVLLFAGLNNYDSLFHLILSIFYATKISVYYKYHKSNAFSIETCWRCVFSQQSNIEIQCLILVHFQERHWTSPGMVATIQAAINSPQSDRLKQVLKIAPRLLDVYFAIASHDINDCKFTSRSILF